MNKLFAASLTLSCALATSPLREHMNFLSNLAPIPCRDDLAAAAEKHFKKTGNAAEIGVRRGVFAAHNLAEWTGNYWAVDAWTIDSNVVDPNTPEAPSGHNFSRLDSFHYNIARDRLQPFFPRARQMRSFSVPAAAKFPNNTFDWIYIDALHTYESVSEDLRAWWPKLREGGIFSGDDYGDMTDTEYMPFSRFQNFLKYPSWSGGNGGKGWWGNTGISRAEFSKLYAWGTVRAVQEFAAEHGAVLHITFMLDCYSFPAWYMVKPPHLHGRGIKTYDQ